MILRAKIGSQATKIDPKDHDPSDVRGEDIFRRREQKEGEAV